MSKDFELEDDPRGPGLETADTEAMNLFVANVPFKVSEQDLRNLFKEFGEIIDDVRLIRDRETGQSKGYAFVKMRTRDALLAIQQVNGMVLDGRRIVVRQAAEPRRAP